ncbi:CGNR zinc finger domain-containing protein [Streptomyces zingiberis]|uniref:Zinc finger CGNR domain-containing protein n=1 Tax=Streptomyces zingiberis TaxID=2053010 RepID=A0ABX1BZ78_9ACTN|nr:ABATE domain-containing protein [Streptomyces zingiberis]NJQ01623.1 hypothetical protein [Streptomyces zingiberis]
MGDTTRREPDGGAIGRLPLRGEPLPLELVNTTYIQGGVRGRLVDALTRPGDLDDWLTAHHAQFSPALVRELAAAPPATPAHVAAFGELRHALRELAASQVAGRPPEPGPVAVVNGAARLAARWPELSGDEDRPARVRWSEGDPRRVALGEVAGAAVELLSGAEREKIRACPAPGCILYFVRSHARRAWCTTGCGNRVRVARHSRRARADGRAGR